LKRVRLPKNKPLNFFKVSGLNSIIIRLHRKSVLQHLKAIPILILPWSTWGASNLMVQMPWMNSAFLSLMWLRKCGSYSPVPWCRSAKRIPI